MGLALLLACASANPSVRPPFPKPDVAELSSVEKLGLEIYERDQAAWRATDAVAEAIQPRPTVQGWITVRDGADWLVRFIGECGDRACAIVDVKVDGSLNGAAAVSPVEQPASLTGGEASAWRARQLAFRTPFRQCTPTYNTVVVPSSRDGRPVWIVYLLAASSSSEVVLAGHHRVVVSEDGRTILSEEPLSNSCIVNEPNPRAVGAFVTHVLDPEPIETHVFTSLTNRMPLYVGTERGTYKVSGAKIELVESR